MSNRKEKKEIIPKEAFIDAKRSALRLRRKLTVFFSKTVFLVLLSAVGIAAATIFILYITGVLDNIDLTALNLVLLFIIMVVVVCLLSFIISIILGKYPLKPVNELINSMNRLAAGNFKTRLKFGKTIAKHKMFKEISDSFNTLAEELENTETLRSDFIDNFSHEFKTPIVSIAGLAKLVNKGNLSEEQKKVYLTAIEEESLRLASMATNVLKLTKIENQTILTNISEFNLSEQIRASVLLLENKWTKKEIEFQLDFDEYHIEANEELLKEVWINLLDNAIKFSPEKGVVCLEILHSENSYTVNISNSSPDIAPENQNKLWNKFYQGDESHKTEGNGVGLSIVKKIVELHRGVISMSSKDQIVTFSVVLPKK